MLDKLYFKVAQSLTVQNLLMSLGKTCQKLRDTILISFIFCVVWIVILRSRCLASLRGAGEQGGGLINHSPSPLTTFATFHPTLSYKVELHRCRSPVFFPHMRQWVNMETYGKNKNQKYVKFVDMYP